MDVAELREMLAPQEPDEPETAAEVQYITDDEEVNRLRGLIASLEDQLADARHSLADAESAAQDARRAWLR